MNLKLGLNTQYPTAQTEVDVFRGHWSYRLPLDVTSGAAEGYVPSRPFLQRCVSALGSFSGRNVLELGPLEGEVTYALHQMGAGRILSIEAREASFLKCLIAKNLFEMDRARFMLGDFVKYLERAEAHFDFCCAQGVLYHMIDPVRLLQLIAQAADGCFIGTHYYDEARLRAVASNGAKVCGINNPLWGLAESVAERETAYEREGFRCVYYRHDYHVTREQQEDPDMHHHHGLDLHAQFMTKEDVVGCLEYFGMEVVDVADEANHPRGPYVGIIARRRAARHVS